MTPVDHREEEVEDHRGRCFLHSCGVASPSELIMGVFGFLSGCPMGFFNFCIININTKKTLYNLTGISTEYIVINHTIRLSNVGLRLKHLRSYGYISNGNRYAFG